MKHLILVATTLCLAGFAHALEVGNQAPCVELNQIAINGSESVHCIRDRAIKTQALVQEFFSVPCSDCHDSFTTVNAAAAQLGEAATFRLIALDRDEKLVRDFVAGNRDVVTHEVALDSHRDAMKAYGVVATPTVFVLNSQNTIIFKHEGVVTKNVAAEIEKAVLSTY
jgi:peroxiredoxin